MGEFTIAQAVSVLEQAVNVGSAKGSYAIKDSALINHALEFIKEYIKSKGDEAIVPEIIKE